ncbi:hypothetical protein AAAV91_08550, partial [Ligilactobacillus ruminis]|uniref:hypothetical protein n=1 Tax=Ligilactobacillus ruminis TaxID=1623 RepID=UPI0032C09969
FKLYLGDEHLALFFYQFTPLYGHNQNVLPTPPKTGRAALKVEQKSKKLRKCSTRLLSPKQCGLRLRSNLKNWHFARKPGLTH